MTEWQQRPVSGRIENRDEYHFSTPAERDAFKDRALETLEDLLTIERQSGSSDLKYSWDKGVARRDLDLMDVDRFEEQHMLFGEGSRVFHGKLKRAPLVSDIFVHTKMYRSGSLRELSEVTIQESVDGEEDNLQLISIYTIENFIGGSFQATLNTIRERKNVGMSTLIDGRKSSDTSDSEQLAFRVIDDDEREMLPYDFHVFIEKLNVIKAIRRGITIENKEWETGV